MATAEAKSAGVEKVTLLATTTVLSSTSVTTVVPVPVVPVPVVPVPVVPVPVVPVPVVTESVVPAPPQATNKLVSPAKMAHSSFCKVTGIFILYGDQPPAGGMAFDDTQSIIFKIQDTLYFSIKNDKKVI